MIPVLLSFVFFLASVVAIQLCLTTDASAYERKPQKPAIVLAAFGTTEVPALPAILNTIKRVRDAFPDYDVHIAFTSNQIRDTWHQRSTDDSFKKANPDIPDEIYNVKNALAVLADIQDLGPRLIIVQSLHFADGEEYTDLAGLVKALSGYNTMKAVLKPFPWIALGVPALGTGDGQPAYIDVAVKALEPYVTEAKNANANLVFMGHGNENLTQKIYAKLQAALRKAYNNNIYIGAVEAEPHADGIIAEIQKVPDAPKSILVAPLMLVAGDHARNDMSGPDPKSWTSQFTAAGFTATPKLQGLGQLDTWVDIFVSHIKAVEPEVKAQQAKDEAAAAAPAKK
ncbi:MAG: sirohydrochlorin cobaltochelatase [Deltaproteobacteria bacterium]|jgi:sirohydrochlorin cobaltochelatase|nr:sirohydrochlorin cobaltochelatase [Deltaproteobacteria bacterium]